MTTSLQHMMHVDNNKALDKNHLIYLKENFKGEVNDQLLSALFESGFTKAEMARRLGKRPESITRWLSAPCNLEIDTIVELAVSLGKLPRIVLESPEAKEQRAFLFSYASRQRGEAVVIQGHYKNETKANPVTATHRLKNNASNKSYGSFSSTNFVASCIHEE